MDEWALVSALRAWLEIPRRATRLPPSFSTGWGEMPLTRHLPPLARLAGEACSWRPSLSSSSSSLLASASALGVFRQGASSTTAFKTARNNAGRRPSPQTKRLALSFNAHYIV